MNLNQFQNAHEITEAFMAKQDCQPMSCVSTKDTASVFPAFAVF